MRSLLVILSLLLAAPAAAQVRTAEEIARLTGPDRQQILEEGARKEGELLWVGSFNEDNAKPILQGFAAKYPFIKVNRVRTDSMKAMHRVLAELRARRGAPIHHLERDRGAARRPMRCSRSARPCLTRSCPRTATRTGSPRRSTSCYNGLAAYNTEPVSPADGAQELRRPARPQVEGADDGRHQLQQLPAVHQLPAPDLGRGESHGVSGRSWPSRRSRCVARARARCSAWWPPVEHKIMINPTLAHVGEYRRKRAPIDVLHSNPTQRSSTPVLMAKGAPHPHATMLLIDYLLGPEAQAMLREAGYFPGNANVPLAAELERLTPRARGFDTVTLDDTKLGGTRNPRPCSRSCSSDGASGAAVHRLRRPLWAKEPQSGPACRRAFPLSSCFPGHARPRRPRVARHDDPRVSRDLHPARCGAFPGKHEEEGS